MDGRTILSQLEAVYGKARAQVLRDNMDSQLFTDQPISRPPNTLKSA